MDPDIPLPSVEGDDHVQANLARNNTQSSDTGNTPFQSLSPEKTPFRTPASHPSSPAPLQIPKSGSKTTTPVRERQKTPILQSKRSSPSLAAGRNVTPSRPLFRRASSNLNPVSPASNGLPIMPVDLSLSKPVTASTVANDYFQKELSFHNTTQNKVMVLIHDSCYGHRFSRPKTSKAALSTIVERPERLLATLLGAATAYVRLGGRHASGSCGPHPDRDPSTGAKPPFVFRKTSRSIELNHPAVTSVHGTKWMEELQILCDSAEAKLAMNGKELVRPIGYGKDETGNSLPKLHEGDLYLCSESLAALQGCLGGVCDAVDAVFSADATTRAFVNIRPPGHHCSSNFPSGFCWLNNVHVGISYAAMNHNLTHAAILDFDLHHGDGSQTITWDHNSKAQNLPKNAASHKKTPIGYYSLHDINSYPCEWGDEEKVRNASLCLQNAHGQSIWNVHLEPWASLSEFWQLYESKYNVLLTKTREFLKHHSDRLRQTGVQPKAAIFLSAGFDACQWESAGMQRHNVNVPTDFYARFTRDVVKLSEEEGLGVDGRVISVLEGGYSDRALTSGVLSHLCGLSTDNSQPGSVNGSDVSAGQAQSYSVSWWSESYLEDLEAMVAGRTPAPAKKVAKQAGNYSSPTQASTMRMTNNARERQSLSAQLEARLSLGDVTPEPPPEVDWVTASYELSRVLIPDGRQTLSCRHDELNAEATKARRERQSILNLPGPSEEKMQLRGRRSKPVATSDGTGRPGSRSVNRRTTIAAVNELPDPTSMDSSDVERPRRRSSAASSILSNFQDMRITDLKSANASDAKAQNPPVEIGNVLKRTAKAKSPVSSTATRMTRSRSRERTIDESAAALQASLRKDEVAPIKITNDSTDTRSSSLSRQSSLGSSHVTKDGMDDLTSGMKKVSIKLKMPTSDQHESNRKKAEEEVQKTKPARKPPIPRATKAKTATTVPKGQRAPSKARKAVLSVTSTNSVAIAPKEDSSTNTMAPPGVKPAEAAPLQQQPTISHPQLAAFDLSSGADSNTNLHQGAKAISVQNIQSTPTEPQEVHPNPEISQIANSTTISVPAATPAASSTTTAPYSQVSTPRKTNSNLPVFTSTTPLRFSGPLQPTEKKETEKGQQSIWDIPDTPQQ